MSTDASATARTADIPQAPTSFLGNVARGAVIGSVEIVPGVSGGTLALVLGVYEALIDSAGSLVRAAVAAVSGLARKTGLAPAKEYAARVQWRLLLPLAIGMLAAIVVVSATLAPLMEDHPIQTRALFAGLIVASIAVPAGMVGRWGAREVTAVVIAAAAAFWLTSLTGTPQDDPAMWMVAAAASVAVCALVLPGVSGSFLLLVLGMYAPTIAAVNDRNLAYLGVFVCGAAVGLALFVTGLQWLLQHRRSLTLAAMTGLMIGSLRALWPWQSEDGALLAPGEGIAGVVALFALGIAAVIALLWLERRSLAKRASGSAARGR